jgi:UDP-glucose 4-epimerase
VKCKRIVAASGVVFTYSYLAWSLCDDNEVVVVDSLSTGNIENIAPIIDSKKMQLIRGNITDIPLTGVDIVYHEAARPSVPRSVVGPISTNEARVSGRLTTLLAARYRGLRRYINVSSSQPPPSA